MSAVRCARAHVVGASVPSGLRMAAAYAWRLLAVGVAVYGAFRVLGRFQLVAVALFVALVIASVLRPLTDLMARRLPRAVAVVVSVLGSIVVLLALLALVGNAVAGEWERLVGEFGGGFNRIKRWLEGPPLHVSHTALADLQGKFASFLASHRSTLISGALSGAGRVIELVTGGVLALFCSVFFIHSGERLWLWTCAQLPEAARSRWRVAGHAAWHTFAGYTRGIIIVAGTNALLVGLALFVLRVPLALPLALLEFVAAFIPLIGSPIALAVATMVALAGRGPLIALVVLSLIVVIGQLEGHVLHPLVLSWAVRLHPLVVALCVIAGSIVAGVIGAVVAVPMASVAWSVIQALRAPAAGSLA
ncbi:AI-2E family transporter [Streptomyces sp. NPDC053427]|uniref:AI-2E family transporter n=1 Tax=Streptomyces sp. NPDC053427 TaxID=3365701 RepID=UPI0037D0C0FF